MEKKKVILFPVLIAFVLVAIFIFNGFQSGDNAIITNGDGTFIEASGMVENNSLNISSEVTGTISELLVNEGDKVKAGDVIAKINNTNIVNQYEQAVTNLKIAEKNVEQIKFNLDNYDSINASSIEQAKSAYLSMEGEYEKLIEGASPDEIRQVEEAYNQAEKNLEYMEVNLNNSKELLESEVISQSNYDEVELKYETALAQYNSAKAKLNQIKSGPSDATAKAMKNKALQGKASYELSVKNGNLRKEELQNQYEVAQINLEQAKKGTEQLKAELDKLEIVSPVDGTVNSLIVKIGEFTSPGKPVVSILDNNNTEIKVYVSEENIGHVKIGQEADIYVDSHSDKVFKGKVMRIGSNAEFTPKNIQTKEERVNTVFEVKIMVMDDSEGVIKPGMHADVNIKID